MRVYILSIPGGEIDLPGSHQIDAGAADVGEDDVSDVNRGGHLNISHGPADVENLLLGNIVGCLDRDHIHIAARHPDGGADNAGGMGHLLASVVVAAGAGVAGYRSDPAVL